MSASRNCSIIRVGSRWTKEAGLKLVADLTKILDKLATRLQGRITIAERH